MSALVKLSAKLPGDEEINGLDGLAEDLKASDEAVLALVWFVPTKTIIDRATGVAIPTVEVRRVEPIGPPHDVPVEIQQLAAQLYEERLNREPLPIDELGVPRGSADTITDDYDDVDDDMDDEAPTGDVVDNVIEFDDGPRLARDPATIGDIFSFEGPTETDET